MIKTDVEIRTYTGEKIYPVGIAVVEYKYKEKVYIGKLYVIEVDVDPIFGREWIRDVELEWADVKCIDINVSYNLNKLLENYNSIFTTGIGKIPNLRGHYYLKEGMGPI